jgi:tRNA pseudouridine38-40 synthase
MVAEEGVGEQIGAENVGVGEHMAEENVGESGAGEMAAENVGVAIAFGYIGDAFHGSQIQPKVRTVQRELLIALVNSEIIEGEAKIRFSSRTDAGVSAQMNVAVFEIPKTTWEKAGENAILRFMNDGINDIVVWAASEVEVGWNCRPAVRRIYRYRLEALREWPEVIDEELFERALACFEGDHNFTGFCRMDADRTPFRGIEWCRPWRIDGRLVGFEIAGESFLWNQVRRIAWSIVSVMKGMTEVAELEAALAEGRSPKPEGVAAPNWLTLWNIEHSDVKFTMPKVDPFEKLTPPPENAGDREHRIWQATADFEQKLFLLRGWLNAFKR